MPVSRWPSSPPITGSPTWCDGLVEDPPGHLTGGVFVAPTGVGRTFATWGSVWRYRGFRRSWATSVADNKVVLPSWAPDDKDTGYSCGRTATGRAGTPGKRGGVATAGQPMCWGFRDRTSLVSPVWGNTHHRAIPCSSGPGGAGGEGWTCANVTSLRASSWRLGEPFRGPVRPESCLPVAPTCVGRILRRLGGGAHPVAGESRSVVWPGGGPGMRCTALMC